jgi:hypothetical protein
MALLKERLSKRFLFLTALTSLCWVGSAEARADTIRVPSDQGTIQAAINAAVHGDTVLVAPGTYRENIDFSGKGITITSEAGPAITIIDGNRNGTVVTFNSGEPTQSVLSGFTIQNGRSLDGGGIFIRLASPVIRNNIVMNNEASAGGGISIVSASPIISSNTIRNNEAGCCGGTGGGGIAIGGGSPQILGNVISDNSLLAAAGGGIGIFGAEAPLIRGNIITRNIGFSQGGGIWMVNSSNALIIQNLIVNNIAATEFKTNAGGVGQGGGIYWLAPNDLSSPQFINNTIVDNEGVQCSGFFLEGFKSHTTIVGNIIVSKKGQTAFLCGGVFDQRPPVFRFNNVHARKGTAYAGILSDQTGLNGNISADPFFADPDEGDFRLGTGSACIEAGDNTPLGLPTVDLDGNPRIIDGNGDGRADVDMGAYEKQGPRITTVAIEGKNLLITGLNFDSDSVILMNGIRQKTKHDAQNITLLIGKKLLKKINPGQTVLLQVRDSDGALSPEFAFIRP